MYSLNEVTFMSAVGGGPRQILENGHGDLESLQRGSSNAEIDVCAHWSDRAALLVALVMRNCDVYLIYGRAGSVNELSCRPISEQGSLDGEGAVAALSPPPGSAAAESRLKIERFRSTEDSMIPACACLAPSGRWLVVLTIDGRVHVVPTKMILGDVTTEQTDAGYAPLFAEDEITTFSISSSTSPSKSKSKSGIGTAPSTPQSGSGAGDIADCLAQPTAAVWYETRHSRRPMLIVSNKAGHVVFIDLLIRKLTASMAAPESIHSLNVVDDRLTTDSCPDTFLLVTGFANRQWLVPIETGGHSVRETLSRIVPSDLKELGARGAIVVADVGGARRLAAVDPDAKTLSIFEDVRMDDISHKRTLPQNAWHVLHTPLVTLTLSADWTLHARINLVTDRPPAPNFFPAAVQPTITLDPLHKRLLEKKTSCEVGSLPGSRVLGWVPVRFSAKPGCLPHAMLVCDTGLYLVKALRSVYDVFIECLFPAVHAATLRVLCDSADLQLNAAAMLVLKRILCAGDRLSKANKGASARVTPLVGLALVKKVQLPMHEVVSAFVSADAGTVILPSLCDHLRQMAAAAAGGGAAASGGAVADSLACRLSATAFDLFVVKLGKTFEQYERDLLMHKFNAFLLENQWYSARQAFAVLCANRLWQSAGAVIRAHQPLAGDALRVLSELTEWPSDATDDFIVLATSDTLSAALPAAPTKIAAAYLRRLENLVTRADNLARRSWLYVVAFADPRRGGNKSIVEAAEDKLVCSRRDGGRLQVAAALSELFIAALARLSAAEGAQRGTTAGRRCNVAVQPLGAGAAHVAAATHAGLFAWGSGRNNGMILGRPETSSPTLDSCFNGDVAPNTATQPPSKDKPGEAAATSPAPIPGLPPCPIAWQPAAPLCIASVAAGAEHCVALTIDGRLYSWGGNNKSTDICRVCVGSYHNAALASDGAVLTWGWGVHGQLANGLHKVNDALVPTPAVTRSGQAFLGSAISCGHAHTLAVNQSGAVFAAGNDAYGQLGGGSTSQKKRSGEAIRKVTVLTAVRALRTVCVSHVASGNFHNVAWCHSQTL